MLQRFVRNDVFDLLQPVGCEFPCKLLRKSKGTKLFVNMIFTLSVCCKYMIYIEI